VKTLPLAAALLLLFAAPAAAHTITPGTTGFTDGLQHPFGLPAHIMMILGVGLLLGRHEIAAWRVPLYGFLASLALGLAGGPFLIAPALEPHLAIALLLLAVVFGCLIATARPLPAVLLTSLLALAGLGLGLDSAPEGTLQQTVAALFGSGFAFVFALLNAAMLAQYAQTRTNSQAWQKIGVRIVGSWIAAAGIMVLALQLR
jgi:hydrogenase/urease accessory protein HupE